mgnify:CR=1 FL=1
MIRTFQHGNSGIDIFEYKGQKTLQVVGVEKAFEALAKENKEEPFQRIIEIGTDYGGLTNLLADHSISEGIDIYTYDINPNRFVSHNDKIKFFNTDVFLIEDEIAELIGSKGKTLLLCDGGNKRKEFEVFHKYLKSGDVIMAHDYAPDDKTFKEKYLNKIWSWHEFKDEYADFKNLKPYMQDVFANFAWCIRSKK